MSHEPAQHCEQPPPQLATFRNDGYDQLVLVRAIPFRGSCGHQGTPVTGTAHVGYLPAELMLGGAALGQLVEFFASRHQSQSLLTQMVAEDLQAQLRPRGIGVMVEAEHSCMAPGCVTATAPTSITWALLGALHTAPSCREEFFALIRRYCHGIPGQHDHPGSGRDL